MIVLGVLPDVVFHPHGYRTSGNYEMVYPVYQQTDWHLASTGVAARSIQLKMDKQMPDQSFSLMVAVGIRFGNPGLEKVEQVKYAGAGKILSVI